jgi:hypothetical protein
MQNTLILALVSAVTALLAVIFAPLVSIHVAMRQAKLQAVVLERKESIKEMRRLFSEFIAYLMIVNGERAMGRISHKDATEKLERAFRLETELSLMLDAKIEDHRTVLSNITEARNRVFRDLDQEFNPAKWEPHYSEAMQALIRILKEERDKVADLK